MGEVGSPDVGAVPSLASLSPGLATAVSARPAVIECWFVEDAGGGKLAKKPAALLLRQGAESPPPRPDLAPERYLKVHGESSLTRSQLCCLPRNPPSPSGLSDLGPQFPPAVK